MDPYSVHIIYLDHIYHIYMYDDVLDHICEHWYGTVRYGTVRYGTVRYSIA